jgi:hypothetical protein
MRWLLLGLSMLPLHAAVIHTESYTTPIPAANIVDPITGADMAGMQVTAVFAGFSITTTWQATGPASGTTAANPLFSLSLTGNTDGTLAWQYTPLLSLTLVSLVLDGTSAGVHFDRTNPSFGVPGSGPGIDMAFSTLPPWINVLVAYERPVNFAVGPHDLYGKVTISFPGVNGGASGLPSQSFQFTQDTDRTGGAGEAPEPGAGLMLAVGIGLIGGQWAAKRYRRGRSEYMH